MGTYVENAKCPYCGEENEIDAHTCSACKGRIAHGKKYTGHIYDGEYGLKYVNAGRVIGNLVLYVSIIIGMLTMFVGLRNATVFFVGMGIIINGVVLYYLISLLCVIGQNSVDNRKTLEEIKLKLESKSDNEV